MSEREPNKVLPNGRRDDPTENVRQLVEAEMKRQDDLRDLDSKWRDRMDNIRASHARDIGQKEAARNDAIRAVDQGNVQRDKEVQSATAATLAAQVATTATAFEAKLNQALEPIQKDIADLRRVQYEGVGQKTQVVEARASDADFAPMVAAIERLTAASSATAGAKAQVVETRATMTATQGYIMFGLALLAASGLYIGTRPDPVVVTPTPAVTVTVPSP